MKTAPTATLKFEPEYIAPINQGEKMLPAPPHIMTIGRKAEPCTGKNSTPREAIMGQSPDTKNPVIIKTKAVAKGLTGRVPILNITAAIKAIAKSI